MSRSKKEIDKELMYKKLMPSQPRLSLEEAEPVSETTEVPREEQGELPAQGAVLPVVHHAPPEAHKVSVPSMDSQKTEIINVMEEIVLSKLESVLSRFQCCRCDRCKKDIVALALNKLPPKYMVLSHGQIPPDIDTQTNAQVVTAMIQAVIKVRAKPRH